MAYGIDLSGKTAVITGSNSGIGLGIAWELARAGADVVLNSFTDNDEDGMSESLAYLSMSHVDTIDNDASAVAEHKGHGGRNGGGGGRPHSPLNIVEQSGGGRKSPTFRVNARVPSGPVDEFEAKDGAPNAYNGYGGGGYNSQMQASSKYGTSGNGGYQSHADFKASYAHTNNNTHHKINEQDETEDLLNWSMALDYDDYASGWAQIGTSAPSDSDKVYT